MKKIARKKTVRKVTIPTDILGDKMSNEVEEVEKKEESIVEFENSNQANNSEPIEIISDDTGEKPTKELSFYEKVTGEKPPKNPEIEPESDEETPQIEKLNKKLFFLGGIVFVLTVVVTTIIGLFIFNSSQEISKQTVSEEQIETPTPTPIPTVKIDRSEWSFEVLNGSGEAGKAKKTGDAIEALGYTVDSLGNAKKSDYSGITVSFVKEIEESTKDVIVSELKKEFIDVTVEDVPPQESDSAILLIVGK